MWLTGVSLLTAEQRTVRARHSELDSLTRERNELLEKVEFLGKDNDRLRSTLDTTAKGNAALKCVSPLNPRSHMHTHTRALSFLPPLALSRSTYCQLSVCLSHAPI